MSPRRLVWLLAVALPVCLLAAVGFLYDRYVRRTSSDLLVFAFYGGVAAIVGYPLGSQAI